MLDYLGKAVSDM